MQYNRNSYEHAGQPDAPVYTKRQLDLAVAAERERCAKLCEGMHAEDKPADYAWTIRTEWAPDADGPNVANNRIPTAHDE